MSITLDEFKKSKVDIMSNIYRVPNG